MSKFYEITSDAWACIQEEYLLIVASVGKDEVLYNLMKELNEYFCKRLSTELQSLSKEERASYGISKQEPIVSSNLLLSNFPNRHVEEIMDYYDDHTKDMKLDVSLIKAKAFHVELLEYIISDEVDTIMSRIETRMESM